MNFNHSNYYCKSLCVAFIHNYKKIVIFFGIKIIIYPTHGMCNLIKIIKLLTKSIQVN